jgi:predicted GNAT superfamily acetyltransferase
VLVVSQRERQRQMGGQGRWDGITHRVLGEFEAGFEGDLDTLAERMNVCRDRVAKAMNRLITRGLVVSNHRRPASYVLSSKGGVVNE